MVEARSYPRENTGEMGTAYMQLVNIFANGRSAFLRMFHNKIFRRKIKKKVVEICSETSKNEVFDGFLAPRRGKF